MWGSSLSRRKHARPLRSESTGAPFEERGAVAAARRALIARVGHLEFFTACASRTKHLSFREDSLVERESRETTRLTAARRDRALRRRLRFGGPIATKCSERGCHGRSRDSRQRASARLCSRRTAFAHCASMSASASKLCVTGKLTCELRRSGRDRFWGVLWAFVCGLSQIGRDTRSAIRDLCLENGKTRRVGFGIGAHIHLRYTRRRVRVAARNCSAAAHARRDELDACYRRSHRRRLARNALNTCEDGRPKL